MPHSLSPISPSRGVVLAATLAVSFLLPTIACAQDGMPVPPSAQNVKPALLEFDFERVPDGPLPQGWVSASPRIKSADGQTPPARASATWAIESTNNVKSVVVRPASPAADFNLLTLQETIGPDLEANIEITPLGGSTDQGGGIMFRIVDERNFYLLRYNPLKKDLRLYRVVDGAGEKLSEALNIEHSAGTSHTLAVRAIGDKLTGWMDGKELVSATDDRYSKAGKVGIWTKSDAATAFRRLRFSDRSQGGPVLATAETNQITINVEGMSCAMCEGTVANTLKKIKGVKNAIASHETKTCTVELDSGSDVTAEQLVRALSTTKYKASVRKN